MRIFVIVFLCWAGLASAQGFPPPYSSTVNDFADLLPDPVESRISSRLARLKNESGVEMTVATLRSRSGTAREVTLEQFATALFDSWGIGDRSRNDGVLLLILVAEREVRIELGAAYGQDWNSFAEQVVEETLVPWLREDDFTTGIDLGTSDIITRIVQPYLEGASPPENDSMSFSDKVFLALAVLAGAVGLFAGKIRQWLIARRACPQCGKRTLNVSSRVLRPASLGQSGEGIDLITCTSCDHRAETKYVIPAQRPTKAQGGGRFGGGRSGGGGASGRF